MARYIDADKMANGLERAIGRMDVDKSTKAMVRVFIEGLQNEPTADVVEVVRCGRCKHWIYWADSKTCSCEIHHIRTIRDDFCSYGERRDE